MRWFFVLLLIGNGAFYYWRSASADLGALVSTETERQGRPIVLLAESEPPSAAQPPGADEEEYFEAAVAQCWGRGPYSEVRPAQELAAENERFLVKVEKLETDVEYWVHLGPFENVAAASAKHRELQDKDIDSFVIRSGPLKNAVSLGLFREEERAELQAKRVRAKGYPGEIRRLADTRLRYWVTLMGSERDPAVKAARRQLFNKQNGGPGTEKKSCKLVASWDHFD